jgi:hypothetical protein
MVCFYVRNGASGIGPQGEGASKKRQRNPTLVGGVQSATPGSGARGNGRRLPNRAGAAGGHIVALPHFSLAPRGTSAVRAGVILLLKWPSSPRPSPPAAIAPGGEGVDGEVSNTNTGRDLDHDPYSTAFDSENDATPAVGLAAPQDFSLCPLRETNAVK